MKRLAFSFMLFLVLVFLSGKVSAAEQILHKTVLTVKGKIAAGASVSLTLESLKKLPQTSFEVTCRRTKTVNMYEGVALADLLAHLKIDSGATVIEVVAENKYKAFVKIEDINRYEYLLSLKKNGSFYHELGVADNKGPLAIAINFDKYPQLDWEIYKHQLVWFVKEITVH